MRPLTMQEDSLDKGTSCPSHCPSSAAPLTVDPEKYDCIISALDRHRGYIVAIPGKKSKQKDKKDKQGVGDQAKTHRPSHDLALADNL